MKINANLPHHTRARVCLCVYACVPLNLIFPYNFEVEFAKRKHMGRVSYDFDPVYYVYTGYSV